MCDEEKALCDEEKALCDEERVLCEEKRALCDEKRHYYIITIVRILITILCFPNTTVFTFRQLVNTILRIFTLLDHYFTYFFYDIG